MTRSSDKPPFMELAQFETLVDTYGADAEAWPADEREQALALLERSGDARRLLDEAAALDALLDEAPGLEPCAALRQQVLDAAPGPRTSRLRRLDRWTEKLWPFTPRWQPAVAMAAAGVLGVVLGASLPETSDAVEPVDVAEIAFGTEADWSEMP